jgi:hypothetical protein
MKKDPFFISCTVAVSIILVFQTLSGFGDNVHGVFSRNLSPMTIPMLTVPKRVPLCVELTPFVSFGFISHLLPPHPNNTNYRKNGQNTLQTSQCQGSTRQEGYHWWQGQTYQAYRIVCLVYLQGPQASPPRYRYQQEGNEYHELLHQGYL